MPEFFVILFIALAASNLSEISKKEKEGEEKCLRCYRYGLNPIGAETGHRWIPKNNLTTITRQRRGAVHCSGIVCGEVALKEP